MPTIPNKQNDNCIEFRGLNLSEKTPISGDKKTWTVKLIAVTSDAESAEPVWW